MKILIHLKRVFIFLAVIFLLCFFYEIPVIENLKITRDDIISPVRFALVTDLHSCRYGKNQKTLIKMIDRCNADAVLLAGDIFDDKIPDGNAKVFLENIALRYKCFYVSGNHEIWSGRYGEMKSFLEQTGIAVLEGNCIGTKINGMNFDLCGVSDPYEVTDDVWENQIESAFSQTKAGNIKILLSHRPERIDAYRDYDFDYIVAGHAHGGQWRLPFFNEGLYAPDQSFFAKYVNGKYIISDRTSLIVSRGLARESTPVPRFGNHPEVLVIELLPESK